MYSVIYRDYNQGFVYSTFFQQVFCNLENSKVFAYEVIMKFKDPYEDKVKDFKKEYNDFIQNPEGLQFHLNIDDPSIQGISPGIMYQLCLSSFRHCIVNDIETLTEFMSFKEELEEMNTVSDAESRAG